MNIGKIYTAYGIDHKPIEGVKQLFAMNEADAWKRFRREYGKLIEPLYLLGDVYSQWERLRELGCMPQQSLTIEK